MEVLALIKNKYVLTLLAFVSWTVGVYNFSFNAGYDKADAECKKDKIAIHEANISTTQWKLDNQKAEYDEQVRLAQLEANSERNKAKRLQKAIKDIMAIDAPDCTAVPDEWVQSVNQAFSGAAD